MERFLLNKPKDALLACSTFWDMDGDFPFPKFDIECTCGKGNRIIRQLRFHLREDSPSRFRAYIHFKCIHCSKISSYGVVIPETMFNKHKDKLSYTHNELLSIHRGTNG